MSLPTYQHYTGTKIVRAAKMTRSLAAETRAVGGNHPNMEEEVYVVEYEDGYVSLSPVETFEKAYIAIGDASDLPPFIQRLKGERAENYDRVNKLRTFLDIQDEKAAEVDDRAPERQAFLDKFPTLDIHQLALQQKQLQLMHELDTVLTQRLELLLPEARVEHKAKIRFSVANGTRFDIMPRIFKALEGQIDACCYTGTIYNIPVGAISVFNQNGDPIDDATVRVEKMVRGFGISGDIGDELLFDIGLDAQRGITHVTSSFSEDFQIEIEVHLADGNRRLV
jgi:hypothetical protein